MSSQSRSKVDQSEIDEQLLVWGELEHCEPCKLVFLESEHDGTHCPVCCKPFKQEQADE